jgi:hypothetical protein
MLPLANLPPMDSAHPIPEDDHSARPSHFDSSIPLQDVIALVAGLTTASDADAREDDSESDVENDEGVVGLNDGDSDFGEDYEEQEFGEKSERSALNRRFATTSWPRWDSDA